MADTIYGVILGLIAGIVLGVVFFQDSYHNELCQEQFFHAETAADSLTIIQNDDYCLREIK